MRIRFAPAAAAMFALFTASALASEHDPNSGAPLPPSLDHWTSSPITDKFYAEGVYYAPHVRTDLRIDPHNAPAGVAGTNLSGERDLGLQSRLNQGLPELMFRFGNRNKIRVDYLESDRSATHQLSQTIQFGNEPFTIGSLLTSNVDWRIFSVTHTYSFIRTDRFEIGAGLGIHLIQAEAMAQVSLNQRRQDVSGAGAFPTIPLDMAFRISRRWSVTARGQYFHAALNNFDGWLADVHEDVQYRWNPNFALGLGYNSVRAKLNLNTGNFPGLFAMSLEGPEFFFRVSF
jgi:hypothetical protein